ncbi:MAG: outer membrane beta-barrel protein [Bacteroidales bacterium]|nr:outer membrane beta-barrel protein [Bacteroidales bacterium]
MKRLIPTIAALLMTTCVCFSQSNDFYGVASLGCNFSLGNFGKAELRDGSLHNWALFNDSEFGGAGIGANANFMLAKRISGIEELSAFVSLEFFFSPLNKTMRDFKERYEVENINSHDKYEQRFPVYLNIPLFAGLRYDIYTSNRNMYIFTELGLGADMHVITDHSEYYNMYKHSSEAYSYDEDFRTKFSFATTIGAGVVFLEHIQVGLHYHYLGSIRVISDLETVSYNKQGDKATNNQANRLGVVTPHLLSLRIGYIF